MDAEPPTIVSPDVGRRERIPPGQTQTRRWPVLHAGAVPHVDLERWQFTISGLVDPPVSWSWDQFRSLPIVRVRADMHCVTGWSLLDNLWEGVSVREVMRHTAIRPEARFALVHAEHGFTTNVPLDDFLAEDCLFAWRHNGQPLEPDHGGPVRLVVPRLYAWKSAKWVTGVELLAHDRPGFWERNGYHAHGDPWTEERYWD